MFVQKFRAKRGVQGCRIGPSEHLLLSPRIIQPFEKFAEAVNKIAFGQQDEHWETHIQFPLDHLELARDFPGLSLHFFGRILDQAFDRDR